MARITDDIVTIGLVGVVGFFAFNKLRNSLPSASEAWNAVVTSAKNTPAHDAAGNVDWTRTAEILLEPNTSQISNLSDKEIATVQFAHDYNMPLVWDGNHIAVTDSLNGFADLLGSSLHYSFWSVYSVEDFLNMLRQVPTRW